MQTQAKRGGWARRVRTALAFAVLAGPWSGVRSASAVDIGIASRFSDVILENLSIGGNYNMTQIKNLPLTIINNSSIEMPMQVEVEAPAKTELQEGYEPIPDVTWVKILPSQFTLAPHARNLSDIVISIPNDPKLVGKSYQVMFWAHSVQQGFLGVGVRVRVRFSIATSSPESKKLEAQKKRMLDLNFRLDPIVANAGSVKPGESLNLNKDRDVNIKLVNTSSTRMKLKIESIGYRNEMTPPLGYEALPDPMWLVVKPGILKAKPDTITPLKLKLKIPNDPKYKGKKYAALIFVSLVGEDIPVNVYSQVLITTEP